MIQYRSLENMKKELYQKYKKQETMKMFSDLATAKGITFDSLKVFFEKFDLTFTYDEFVALEMKFAFKESIDFKMYMNIITP